MECTGFKFTVGRVRSSYTPLEPTPQSGAFHHLGKLSQAPVPLQGRGRAFQGPAPSRAAAAVISSTEVVLLSQTLAVLHPDSYTLPVPGTVAIRSPSNLVYIQFPAFPRCLPYELHARPCPCQCVSISSSEGVGPSRGYARRGLCGDRLFCTRLL